MTIDMMKTTDLAAVHGLLRACQLPVEGLDPHVATGLVARDGDRIVASAALEVHGRYALLRSVAVEAEHRGQGVGVLISSEAIALGRRLGLDAIYLLTETAPRFFPKLGFAPIARAEVPPPVQESVEFTTVCCASAQAMHLPLR